MRFGRLDLLRYGHFTDRSFGFPAGDVDFHVVFGLNEAGKSTALSAIEDLLFGIPVRTSYNFLHDYGSLRIGAVLENEQASLQVVRRKGRKDTLLGTDQLPLPGGETALRPFLAGADRPFFERMFSLDHVRLESGGREILEAKDDVGQVLFSAGAGLTGLRDRLEELSHEADGLWAPRRARRRKFYQALDRLRDAGTELRQRTVTAHKWQELKQAFERAEETYAGIESEFENLSAEGRRLSRIRRVYRDVCRMVDLEEEKDIAALEKVVPLPEDARRVLEESERRDSELTTRIETLSGRLAKAREELGTLEYDERLILRDPDITHLHERRIEIRRGKDDLPKRQAELAAAEVELRDLAAELGWKEEVGRLISRIPARTKLGVLRSLLGQRGKLASDRENRDENVQEAQAEREEIRQTIEVMGETLDVSRLRSVIRAIRESGDITGRVRRAELDVKHTQDRLDRLLSALHPAVESQEAATEMRVPPAATVQAHRDKLRSWERRNREAVRQLARAKEELHRARGKFRSATREEQVVSMETLREARDDRDALWRLARKRHIENLRVTAEEAGRYAHALDDLATAVATAIRNADDLADRRFDNAEAAGRLAEMSRTIDEQESGVSQLTQLREHLVQEGERLHADWETLWSRAPFSPLLPDDMLEWLKTRNDLLEAVDDRAKAARTLEVHREEMREARAELLAEFSSLGADPGLLEQETLPMLLERADGIRVDHEQEADTKSLLEDRLQEAKSTLERRRRELARAEQAWVRWQKEWSAALTEVGLTTASNPDSVSALIDVMDRIREKSLRINDLRHQRIGKIRRDVADFEALVEKMVHEVARDLSGTPAEDAVVEIEDRLADARRTRDLRVRKEQETRDLENSLRVLMEDRETARGSVNYLRDAAGVATSGELRNAIEKSDSLRALKLELAAIRHALEQQGDGLTAAELEEECDNVDLDQVVAQEDTTQARLRRLREQLAAAAEQRAQARSAFQAVGGDAGAARAEAARQEALVDLGRISERYVRVRTSVLLLRWAIDRYRREKQVPLLRRAGQLFAIVTGGSFTDLRVDYDTRDQAHLIGKRPDGEAVPVSGMSRGTADQLYFALRIASIEDYLGHAASLPFVADDLFVNFDDDRARAGFQVLGELARKTQVLFFTHHRHLLEIAQETLGGSVSDVDLTRR